MSRAENWPVFSPSFPENFVLYWINTCVETFGPRILSDMMQNKTDAEQMRLGRSRAYDWRWCCCRQGMPSALRGHGNPRMTGHSAGSSTGFLLEI